MEILRFIEQRSKIGFGRNIVDKMLEEASKSTANEVAVIQTEDTLTNYRGVNKDYILALRENYKLKGMFDLGIVLPNTSVNLILYIFTKGKNEKFTVGEYHGSVIKHRKTSNQEFDWNTLYAEEYYIYLHKIEEWIDSGLVENDEHAKFNVLNYELFEDVFAPKRYSENVYRVKSALEKEKPVTLSEVADIIRPKPDNNRAKKSFHLSVSEWKYPIDYSKLREGTLTNTPLRKNDILFMDFDHIYLVDEEPQREIHISSSFYLIRPKNILPQYLLMYLQSETAKIIMQSLSMGSVLNRIRMADMLNIPVIRPSLSETEYLHTFKLKYYKQVDIAAYSREKRLLAYYLKIQKLKISKDSKTDRSNATPESIEKILEDEWAQNIRVCKTEVMKEFLESDIKELNTCFSGKAYKATLILAGSILEAVLIDWLSEIKSVNYFDEQYMVTKKKWDSKNNCVKRDKNGNIVYYETEAKLSDYIDEIKKLARPRWMKDREAHEIRKKRNLVHAKLCMNDSVEINEQTCREVIQYLKDVIETRGIHQD